MKKEAVWIWYPGDFEIALAKRVMTRRYERDVFIPPFWRLDDCYHNVKFSKEFALPKTDILKIKAEGLVNVSLNGKYIYGFKGELIIPPGDWLLEIVCYNAEGLPALFVEGEEIVSDLSWNVTCGDGRLVQVRTSRLVSKDSSPNDVRLPVETRNPICKINRNGKIIYDFGEEVMAYLQFEGVVGSGRIALYYGESLDEAQDFEQAETFDILNVTGEVVKTDIAKAFRYVAVDTNLKYFNLVAHCEYLPLPFISSFESSHPQLDAIYQISLRTLHLNTREFMLDGIKRDRWIWSGDAYQSYLMNYYSFADREVVQRTMIALFGKPPVATHINHIMDYSFYWVLAFYDYYLYTGDLDFVRYNFDKILAIIDFCRNRTNANGLMEGLPGDWVFVDWADLDNRGEVAFEQILYLAALKAVVELGCILGAENTITKYQEEALDLEKKIEKFWDEKRGGYIYSYKTGCADGIITKHSNIMAVLYKIAEGKRRNKIKENVLMNDTVPAITTPFMRFFELAALCELGETDYVLNEILNYWGGMLSEGATSFWETYDATQKGKEKYAMYGRAYGKSLCHAWGASPLYLIGKYIVGLRPLVPGYKKFELCPHLGCLAWFRTKLPLAEGYLDFYMSRGQIKIYSDRIPGQIVLQGKRTIKGANYIYRDGNTLIEIERGTVYEINWK